LDVDLEFVSGKRKRPAAGQGVEGRSYGDGDALCQAAQGRKPLSCRASRRFRAHRVQNCQIRAV